MKNSTQIFDQLKQPLEPKRVKKRQGGGGTSLSYLETHDVISHLNKIFGYDGWEFLLLGFEQFATPKGLVFRQTVALTIHIEGVAIRREDVGIGIASNTNSDQLEKGMKDAASDGLKRAARFLGEQFGNSLYEKDAPEHSGQSRARLATQDQLTECENLRGQAVKLGFLTPKGAAPKMAPDGTEERAVLAKIAAYRDFIEKSSTPETPTASTARFDAWNAHNRGDAYGQFVAAAIEKGLPWANDDDIAAFENAATPKTDMPVVVEQMDGENEGDWAIWAKFVADGSLRWGA